MSYRTAQTNGGYGSSRYDEGRVEDSPGSGGSRQRRAGGYGGFYDGASTGAPPVPEQQAPITYRRRGTDESGGGFGHFASGRRDTDDYGPSQSRDRSIRSDHLGSHGVGPGGRQIDDVLGHINEHWGVLMKDECVPVHVAMQLMDYSSLGRGNDYQDFQRTSKYLQKALKTIVNEHHQGFNSSIGTFHKIQSSIQLSQSRVRHLRDSIHGAKGNLMVTKPELKSLGSSSQEYDDMLQILNQIEKLQSVPEQLDTKISEKHFLSAVDLLQDALRIIRKSDMEELGALTDLRIYFGNQETSMTDILIEELHDHLYLKSAYCQSRWKPYEAKQGDISIGEKVSSALPNTWGRPLYKFLEDLDTSEPMVDDASRDPENDSFEYMHMLLESLSKLGHLDIAVDRMEQRLPVELFAIVDRTNHEVDLRYSASRAAHRKGHVPFAFDLEERVGRNRVLDDLLWTLYSKFEAIAEGHRVVHEIVSGIVDREGVRDKSRLTRGFKEMWKLYQSEMRSLLHDYLATDGSQSYRLGRQPTMTTNIFQRQPRERTKRVFKLSEVDQTSADLSKDQHDLEEILEASVPGLVIKSQRRSGLAQTGPGKIEDGPAAGHKLLTEPNVFNICSLLPPSLSFLSRLKDIVPHDADIAMSTLTSFLDEFLVNVFHPQLEDTVTELCNQSFLDLEAFQQDPQWRDHASRPIFKGSYNFLSLIRSFCRLLDSIPPDLTSTQLIITQILAYYDRCCEWYKVLVRRPQMQTQDESRPKPGAAMAESGEMRAICEGIFGAPEVTEQSDVQNFLHLEVTALIAKSDSDPLEPFDIISDQRSVTALCLIYNSMEWLAEQLHQLRRSVADPARQRSDSTKSLHSHHLALTADGITNDQTAPVYLPMNREAIAAFDGILASIRAFAATALYALHIDIRLGIIHMLARTMSAHYLLAQPAQDPDPSILTLNADLLSTVDTLSSHLPARAQTFIISGLSLLIDTYFVSNASHITQGMNGHGCGRMQLNILVLSQNLKSIEEPSLPTGTPLGSIDLARSGQYFDLFLEGADSIVSRAKDRGGEGLEAFDLEELKTLVELWYKEGVQSSQREIQVKSQRELGDRLLILSEYLWNR